MNPKIKAIHPYGPAVGEFVKPEATDIRETFARFMTEAARPNRATGSVIVIERRRA